MKINSISGIVIYVSDLEKAAKFYEGLGFRIGKRETDTITAYVNWFWINFRVNSKASNKPSSSQLYMKVDNIDEYYKAIETLGYKPVSEPKKSLVGGSEICLVDPDGHELVFFAK